MYSHNLNFAQMMNRKQFIEVLMLSCPPPLYSTHLAPIVGPVFEHLRYRLETSWQPIVQPTATGPVVSLPASCKPLFTSDCEAAAALASNGGEAWYSAYYARSCLFVGDLDYETAEAAVEKYRVEFTRTWSDMIQSALALKGDWALVLANMAKEDDPKNKKSDGSSSKGPPNRFIVGDGGKINADGTPRNDNHSALDARKLKRINCIGPFPVFGK